MAKYFRRAGLVALGLSVLALTPARADLSCNLEVVTSSYKSGVFRLNLGDGEAALERLQPLAEAGYPPAQWRLATMYQRGIEVDEDLLMSAFWAQLGAWGGDREAAKMVRQLGRILPIETSSAAKDMAESWRRPEGASCGEAPERDYYEEKAEDERLEALSWDEEEDEDDAAPQFVDHLPVGRNAGINVETHAAMTDRITEAYDLLDTMMPYAKPLVRKIDGFQVVPGTVGDRALDWLDRDGQNVMTVSTGFLLDRKVTQLAFGIGVETQRRVYAKLSDTTYLDSLVTQLGSTRIYGSWYGDTRNDRFFEKMNEAWRIIGRMPVQARRAVGALDEIRYMPPSRFQTKNNRASSQMAFYDRDASAGGVRKAVVTRRVGAERSAEWALELVRLGVYALQHDRYDKLKAELARQSGKAGVQPESVIQAITDQFLPQGVLGTRGQQRAQELVKAWEEADPRDPATQAVVFECEALEIMVGAAEVANLSPAVLARNPRLQVCDRAEKLFQNWAERVN